MRRLYSEVIVGAEPLAAQSILVVQAEYGHDTASVVLRRRPVEMDDGTPISLLWGAPPNTQQFYGYIHHVEPVFEQENRFKIACIGATYPLMGSIQRTWEWATIDRVIAEIASHAYLSADVEPHPTVWRQLAANESAWTFMTSLAKKAGYTLAANRTEIRCLLPTKAIARSAPGAPVLELGQSLKFFRPIVGQGSDAGRRAVRTVYGVDPRSGRQFAVTNDGSGRRSLGPDKVHLTFGATVAASAESPDEAQADLAGITTMNRFAYQADAEADGDARIVQASVVYIDGVESRYAGHWYVHRVEHDFSVDGYRVFLRLGKDALGSFSERPVPGMRVPLVKYDRFGELLPVEIPTKWLNGLWRSAWGRR